MQQIIREVDSFKDSGLAMYNPSRHLESIYDIRRNAGSCELPYRLLREQGVQSEALKQLCEYL